MRLFIRNVDNETELLGKNKTRVKRLKSEKGKHQYTKTGGEQSKFYSFASLSTGLRYSVNTYT